MNTIKEIALFEGREIRKVWYKEKLHFSIVDVVAILSDSNNPRKYWNKLKERLKGEGSELVTKCHQLKLAASDGKYYFTCS